MLVCWYLNLLDRHTICLSRWWFLKYTSIPAWSTAVSCIACDTIESKLDNYMWLANSFLVVSRPAAWCCQLVGCSGRSPVPMSSLMYVAKYTHSANPYELWHAGHDVRCIPLMRAKLTYYTGHLGFYFILKVKVLFLFRMIPTCL